MTQIYTELTGFEFNAHHNRVETETETETEPKTKFYKFLRNNLTHYDFEYKLGLNIDIEPFNPNGSCSSGGLYFCEESNCHLYWENYGQKLAIIEIPDDARVYVEEHKFKADKIIITKIINFKDVKDSFWINMLPRDGLALRLVKEQTEDICISAIRQNSIAMKYVKEQTEEICKFAVQKNGNALRYVNIHNQTEELCIMAVKEDGFALQYVIEQTEEICKFAVQQYGFALEYVIEQTEEICKFAVMQNGNALKHVKNQTDEICILAVEQDGNALEYVKNQTEEICIRAVQQDGNALEHVKNGYMPYELRKLAVQQNGFSLLHFKDEFITAELYKLAIQQNWRVAHHRAIKMNKTINMAIRQDGMVIYPGANASNLVIEEIRASPVQYNGYALEFVKNMH